MPSVRTVIEHHLSRSAAAQRLGFIDRSELSLKRYLQQTDAEKGREVIEKEPFLFHGWVTKKPPGEKFGDNVYYLRSDIMFSMEEEFGGNGPNDFDAIIDVLDRYKSNPDYNALLVAYFKSHIWRDNILNPDKPSWFFMDFKKVVKNQWLIHFTDNAYGVGCRGFKYGVGDVTRLGLTSYVHKREKAYGGYNFAFRLKDFARYASARRSFGVGGWKYGKEAVLFRASGVLIWHHGDNEPQVVFTGKEAKDFIAITEGEESTWAVGEDRAGRRLFESDNIEEVTAWSVTHFRQYRKHLLCK